MKVELQESLYQPSQKGLIFPEIPRFSSMEEERRYLKEHLVGACRMFAKHNFGYGFAGHLTIRDPEYHDLYWTNPMAVPFSCVCVSNLVLVDHSGNVVEGDYAINQAGFVLHAAVHKAHPEIVAMCHAHTIHGTAWSTTGRELDPISQDATVFYGTHCVLDEEAGKAALETEAGSNVSEAFGKYRAIIHRNHGLFTASTHSIDAAAFWFRTLDRCCQQQLLVEASGVKPTFIPAETARYSQKHIGSEYIGWLHFQSCYKELVHMHPEMLL